MTAIISNRAIRGPVTAVPVVAGHGVRLVSDTVNNRIVAEEDETVLWEQSSYTYGITSVTLSESYRNFETIKIFTNKGDVIMFHPDNSQSVTGISLTHFLNSNIWIVPWSFTDDTHFAGSEGKMLYTDAETSTIKYTSVTSGSPYGRWEQPEKIVGVNRIASN